MALVWVTAGKKRNRKGISLWVCTGASFPKTVRQGSRSPDRSGGGTRDAVFPTGGKPLRKGDAGVFRNVGGDAGGLSR